MIPNLTLIIAAYVIVRLATIALRQYPRTEGHKVTRTAVAVGSVLALGLVTLCALDTLGIGLRVGSALDAKHGRPFARSVSMDWPTRLRRAEEFVNAPAGAQAGRAAAFSSRQLGTAETAT